MKKKESENNSLLFQKFFKIPSPANFAEIIAMWPYLSDESKIIFFIEKENKRDLRVLIHLMNSLCVLALESANPYIRYLAAKEYIEGWESSKHLDPQFQTIIKNDPHHLVKYLHLEGKYSLFGPDKEDFEDLLRSNHQARLAIVKSGEIHGENLAELISYFCTQGLPLKKISAIEIYEFIDTCLSAERFIWKYTRQSTCGMGAYTREKELENLWKLIPIVPQAVALLLINKLPSLLGGCDEIIPEEILKSMTTPQLSRLLYRSDVYQENFRKKLFFKICNESNNISDYESDDLLHSVITHNFTLEFDEFLKILQSPSHKTTKILTCLLGSQDCSPVILLVSGDYLLSQDLENNYRWRNDFSKAKEGIRDGISKGVVDDYQVRELRLYTLAKKIMPWGEEKPRDYLIDTEGLRFLLPKIERGKTLETYQSLHDAWHKEYRRQLETFDELLPKLKF